MGNISYPRKPIKNAEKGNTNCVPMNITCRRMRDRPHKSHKYIIKLWHVSLSAFPSV